MISFDDLIPQQKKTTRLERDSNRVGAAIAGAADMASFGFGDELTAGLGAIPALFTDKTLAQAYSENLARNRAQNKAIQERNPNSYLAGGLVGALGTGIGGAATKGGAAIANSLRTGRLGLRAGKAALLGAATSGLAGAGAGEGFENRLESSGDSALAGGLLGGAIPVVGAVAGKVGKQFQKLPSPATADDIKALANAAYKKADETGGVLKGWFTNRFLDDIADIKPASVAGKQVPTDPKLSEALDYINSFKNTRLTLQDAQNLDEYLGEAIDGFTDAFGKVNKSGKKLLDAQSRFRNAIETADETLIEGGKEGFEALKEARKLWSAQLKMRDIERIIQNAELTQNPSTAIQSGFRNLLTNAKKSKGYTKEELAAIEKAAQTGVVSDILKTGGSRLVPIIAGASGGGVMGTAVAGAGAAASRGLATRNAMVNAENVARAVSQRAIPQAAPKGGLPAVLANPRAGQLAAPAGAIIGGQFAQPMQQTITTPVAPTPALDFNDLIPQQGASLMESIKQAESGGNPNAQNPRSSASGLYQFTDSTWRSAVDKWGNKYGITLEDKNNPQAQELLAQELTADNARILTDKIGRSPTDGDIYIAHVFGANTGAKIINSIGSNRPAFLLARPADVQANKSIFFKDGKINQPRTAEEVYALLASKVMS